MSDVHLEVLLNIDNTLTAGMLTKPVPCVCGSVDLALVEYECMLDRIQCNECGYGGPGLFDGEYAWCVREWNIEINKVEQSLAEG